MPGAGNLGDEAILLAELLAFREHLESAEFYILSFDPERTRQLVANIPEVKSIVRMGAKRQAFHSDFTGILTTFRTVDVVLIGGGGLFQDVYNHYPIPFFTALACLTCLYRKRLIFYCLGIGPVHTWIGKTLCAFAANLAEMIFVRAAESK